MLYRILDSNTYGEGDVLGEGDADGEDDGLVDGDGDGEGVGVGVGAGASVVAPILLEYSEFPPLPMAKAR